MTNDDLTHLTSTASFSVAGHVNGARTAGASGGGPEEGHSSSRGESSGNNTEAAPVSVGLMKVWTPTELGEREFRPTWTHKGWRSHPSHGQQAGMEKTLKSWIAGTEAVCVAAGLPLFGRFECVTSGPVVIFTGESGASLYDRRLRHVARSSGLTDAEYERLPLYIIDERATTRSERFQNTLRHTLSAYEQVLTVVDPLYSYHGADVEAGNVHAASEVLNAVSDMTDAAESTLNIVNHFRKSGDGRLSLTDITQAGGREWVESWVLVGHRTAPSMADVREGRFKLEVVVGGRQWDGDAWDIDVSLGRFNRDTFDYEGSVEWAVGAGGGRLKMEQAILDHLEAEDKPVTKTTIVEAVGGNKQAVLKKVDEMAESAGFPVRATDEKRPKYHYDREWQGVLRRLTPMREPEDA